MILLKATLVWLLISIVLGLGIWLLAVKSSPWLLLLWAVGFVLAVARIGCREH
jgi:hypothetical protein